MDVHSERIQPFRAQTPLEPVESDRAVGRDTLEPRDHRQRGLVEGAVRENAVCQLQDDVGGILPPAERVNRQQQDYADHESMHREGKTSSPRQSTAAG